MKTEEEFKQELKDLYKSREEAWVIKNKKPKRKHGNNYTPPKRRHRKK